MRTPSLALAWQLWGRHRHGLAVALACWLLAALLAAVLPAASPARHAVGLLGCALVWPLTLLYLTALFAYGFDGAPIEGGGSCFPARAFTLPVRTRALVGWPMLHGTLAVALAWIGWAVFVFRPCDLDPDLPLWGPALLLAAVLAWIQALLWVPFGLPYVRLVVLLAVPFGLVAAAGAGWVYGVDNLALAGLFAWLTAVAYAVAWAGVSRARRGDVPASWQPEGGSPARVLRPLLDTSCPLHDGSIRNRPPGTSRAAGAPRPPAPGRVPGLPVSRTAPRARRRNERGLSGEIPARRLARRAPRAGR
jgi:hypothetical protein